MPTISAAAYNTPERAEFYAFSRSLDAAKASLQRDTTLILSKDSPIAQIFYGEFDGMRDKRVLVKIIGE